MSAAPSPVLFVGTRKGAFFYHGSPDRRTWRLEGPHFLGCIVNHIVQDPRDGRTLLMSARTGHLGPTVFRSTDMGKQWTEASRPPAFPKQASGEGRAVDHTFWLTPGHASQPGVWWAGTSPPGLFRSGDHGATWDPVEGFNDGLIPRIASTIGPVPDGPIAHSILIDPRDPSRMYAGISTGGFFESRDAGGSWQALNKGVAADFIPEPDPEFGHDPHCVVLHPLRPDRLWQQNHCGIYRLDRPADTWERIGRAMPADVGDIGFPIVAHPRDPDVAWVIPMDGTTVWPRTSVAGRPAVYRTRNGGKAWERQDKGLPPENAWHTVKRQSFAADAADPLGLYFGTTSGEIWMSGDEGASWRQIAAHLPMVLSLTAAPGAA
jgi:photosystem II stability/assembly factor-like uncharacterized protein